MHSIDIKSLANRVLTIERDTITQLSESIDEKFVDVVNVIHQMKGRLIISGIGKSAIIAKKIVATLNSTGTSSIFLHAADAIHGDAGMIDDDDVVIVISKSGQTPEIIALASLVKTYGNQMIAMTSNEHSQLANLCQYLLYTPVEKEADDNVVAPTSSTIAQMALGDALAICLLNLNEFTIEQFAKYHPGGNIGKRLLLKVSDLASKHTLPIVNTAANIDDVILAITKHRLGATCVVDSDNKLCGIVTDGDLRRMIQSSPDWTTKCAGDVMTPNPKTVEQEMLAVEALAVAKDHNISQLPVLLNGKLVGMVHLHDFLQEGLA